jgi:hypothetical protein
MIVLLRIGSRGSRRPKTWASDPTVWNAKAWPTRHDGSRTFIPSWEAQCNPRAVVAISSMKYLHVLVDPRPRGCKYSASVSSQRTLPTYLL